MLSKLFPPSLNNEYRVHWLALWIFGLIIAIRALQSTMIIFNGYNTVTGADGIPIDSYPADAAQTILALFGLGSLWRLLFSVLGTVVLVRYRTAVPLMFCLLLLHFLAVQLFAQWVPIVRVGTPPGPVVNLVQFGLIVIGLGLSLLPRDRRHSLN